ncbi:cytosolic carboxypeptidase [Acrasis kona]|uniref:Cytosolic carboxypeptidase n=1 Tax=Acrasis kona TaxID=1008807 RepID=A0AAW2ZMR9_9EUKA
MLEDAQRINNPSALLNRVVFDCIDPSPMHNTNSAPATQSNLDLASLSESTPANSSAQPKPQELKQYYVPIDDQDTTLFFESRFESGNLRRAIQVYEYEYDLILKFDVNTKGHTQWFYFSVKNARKGIKYKFNIINLVKGDSLYNYGMKPLAYSEYDASRNLRGWYRSGVDICYYQNNIKRKSGYFYTFTWSQFFDNDNDTYYFSYCYPYTYTNLQNYLNSLENDSVRRKLFRRRTLCQTLAGNNCDLLTITSFMCDPQSLKNRKGVVISARVHPGESNASWMMKGVIDFLTGPSLDAKILRDNFVFKIVPMLNPDGVINGNYRCSLAGFDLNRRWNDCNPKLCPTIHHTKQMVKRFMEDREVILSCDFHGHSRKKNIFMYGCHEKSSTPEKRLAPRVFPRILWKISHNFSFQDCNFSIQRSKESTARVVLFKEFGLVNSYTLEASFCGPDFGRNSERHFNTRHLEQMGHFFCESILDYCDPDQTRVKQVIRELELLYPITPPTSDGEVSGNDDSSGSEDRSDDDGKKRKKKRKKRRKKKDVTKEKTLDSSKKETKKNVHTLISSSTSNASSNPTPIPEKKKKKKKILTTTTTNPSLEVNTLNPSTTSLMTSPEKKFKKLKSTKLIDVPFPLQSQSQQQPSSAPSTRSSKKSKELTITKKKKKKKIITINQLHDKSNHLIITTTTSTNPTTSSPTTNPNHNNSHHSHHHHHSNHHIHHSSNLYGNMSPSSPSSSSKFRNLEFEDRGSLTDDGIIHYRNTTRRGQQQQSSSLQYQSDGKSVIRYMTDDDIQYNFKFESEDEEDDEEEDEDLDFKFGDLMDQEISKLNATATIEASSSPTTATNTSTTNQQHRSFDVCSPVAVTTIEDDSVPTTFSISRIRPSKSAVTVVSNNNGAKAPNSSSATAAIMSARRRAACNGQLIQQVRPKKSYDDLVNNIYNSSVAGGSTTSHHHHHHSGATSSLSNLNIISRSPSPGNNIGGGGGGGNKKSVVIITTGSSSSSSGNGSSSSNNNNNLINSNSSGNTVKTDSQMFVKKLDVQNGSSVLPRLVNAAPIGVVAPKSKTRIVQSKRQALYVDNSGGGGTVVISRLKQNATQK